ncbi:MAG: NifU N-terminal domain-containing protein [Acidimicrobiia bacterium]|nr:NifU N-terminal domain-containing protein [Acidimicrobiia bacterium]
MAIGTDRTPNPNALKFTVGKPVGGPVTYTDANAADSPLAEAILSIPGVVSMFMTADFVTLTKTAEAAWSDIESVAVSALEAHFG